MKMDSRTKLEPVRGWIVLIIFSSFVALISCINVTYDSRSLIIDGKRRFLQSGSIHYPRSTPDMWPSIIHTAKEGGIDVIETYIFWSVHEPSRGQYNFEGRNDLIKFAKTVAGAGLSMIVRVGPYVCAEWSFGGFPVWLRNVPDIEFRIANKPFYDEMQRFVTKIVQMLKAENLFASQGGPIILSQIDNEYSNVQDSFNDPRRTNAYLDWAAMMAVQLGTGTPWFMSKQDIPPEPNVVIETCNGFYCDTYTPNTGQPMLWTENWDGWMTNWGGGRSKRPPQDIAFAVGRFFEKGGSLQNYYMYYGGTSFERWAGVYVTTSYDYDAPIDEYGQPNQPKWGHLKDLHAAIKSCELALGSSERISVPTNDVKTEIDIYTNGDNNSANLEDLVSSSTLCAAFLANTYDNRSVDMEFNGKTYTVPPWSITILPDCKTPVFNTAQIKAATTSVSYIPGTLPKQWEYYTEPVGMWANHSESGNSTFKARGMVEHFGITNDKTDYLWYMTSVYTPDPLNAMLELKLRHPSDTVHIFVNDALVGADNSTFTTYSVERSVSLKAGYNSIALLSMPVGQENFGAYYENYGRGIEEATILSAVSNKNLTDKEWTYQIGSQGEHLKLYTEEYAGNVQWHAINGNDTNQPLTWYKTLIDSPAGSKPVALDLGGMGRGQAWINGHGIGRFWSIKNAEGPWGVYDDQCDYRGKFNPGEKCRTGFGQLSQRWYHVPRSWLKPTNNVLVLYEEIGGDPTQVSLTIRERK